MLPISPYCLQQRNQKHYAVRVVHIHHETGNKPQDDPLLNRPFTTRSLPVPKEQCDGKRGVCMRPGWIEVHVNWQRASPPYSKRTHERPASIKIVNCKAIGKAKSEKAIKCRSQSHRYQVGKRETVSWYTSS